MNLAPLAVTVLTVLTPLAAVDVVTVSAKAAPAHCSGGNQAAGTLHNTVILDECIRTTVTTVGTVSVRHGFSPLVPLPVAALLSNG